MYADWLKERMYSMDENELMIDNKSLNGHQYFATVYRLEKQRIVQNHLNIIDVCIHILNKMKQAAKISAVFF